MRRCLRVLAAVLIALGLFALPATASAQDMLTIDPSDPRLVPNPIESSDAGTVWTCRVTGPEVQCTGTLTFSWELQEGPGDWCAVPLYSINGTFTRTQFLGLGDAAYAGKSGGSPADVWCSWRR